MSRTPAAFFFDLASPLAYLAAERILHELPVPAEWQPVLARELEGADSFDAYRCREERELFVDEIERGAQRLGLQPLRWPDPFPFDSSYAMRVAAYAKSIGRAVPFAQAAFRQAFAGGRALQDRDAVLIAAAACEMHPAAVLRAGELESVAGALATSTSGAARAGVRDVPAIALDGRLFEGRDAVQRAAAHVRAGSPRSA